MPQLQAADDSGIDYDDIVTEASARQQAALGGVEQEALQDVLHFCNQDRLRDLVIVKRLAASTRLAKANSLNSCAVFLARPR
ncbi:Uncharacterised protein [Janthinobacterium lividum]|nr:hypothetical protein JANLI_55280 [Janthinobacterium lividum]STS86218.1 Uncharacterised protein [Janthinobacterium lividum]